MRPILIGAAIVFCSFPSCARTAEPWRPAKSDQQVIEGYCVVSLVDKADPYYVAARELQQLHQAVILQADATSLESLLPELQKASPHYVAIVLRPETLDANLVGRFMRLATNVDDDPFLDFAYGFITGDSPQTALSLIEAGQLTDAEITPGISMVGVMGGGQQARSSSTQQRLPLRSGYLEQTVHMVAGTGTEGKRDSTYIESVMPKMDRNPILVFAGHGYPREVVDGPTFEHLRDRDFRGSVALNIACYTGVTGIWYEDDWKSGKVKRREVPGSESFCLNMLKTGVAGYVAYACARPAGPTMLGDAISVAISGQSLGELRRRDGNSVVLTHLQEGFDAIQIREMTADMPLKRNRKTQDFLISMSTGGLLFGDPACIPFAERKESDPRSLTTSVQGDVLSATVRVSGPLWHFFCADQITMWDETTPSFKIESIIPLGDRSAKDVRLSESSFGDVPHQLIAAVEEHHHGRRLHVKASFQQPAMPALIKLSRNGVLGVFEVTLGDQEDGVSVIRRGDRG